MIGRSQSQQVVVPAQQGAGKRAVTADNGNRELVSCIACISAAGAHLQPVLVFKRSLAKKKAWGKATALGSAIPDESRYLGSPTAAVRVFHSDNGFVTSDTTLRWLREVFLPATERDPPRIRVLIVDGAGAHITHEVMYECAKNDVKLVYLPAHSSHITQPLDLAVFSPLKNFYGQAVRSLSHRLAGKAWGREQFIDNFLFAWQKAVVRQNVVSGFRTAGIWPVDMQAVRRGLLLHNNGDEIASDAARPLPRPVLGSLSSNLSSPTPRSIKRTRAAVLEAGKGRLAALEDSVAENARKDRLIEELRTAAEQRSFELADAQETIAALRAKATRPRRIFKAQALAAGVVGLKDLLGDDYTDTRWLWVAEQSKQARIEPQAWLEGQDQDILKAALQLVIPANIEQSTNAPPSRRRQKKSV